MQCPRCGLVNDAEAAVCSRCGLGLPASPPPPEASGPLLPLLASGVAAVLALAYTGWAVSGRLGIFAAFAAGRHVSLHDARTNDRVDTVLAAVAGVAVLVALAVWLARRLSAANSQGLLDSLGVTLTGIGALVAVVGLFLAGRVAHEVDEVAAGRSGVTASLVTAMGFGMAAVGLILGLLAARRPSPFRSI
jgi:uncharacterized membrane protein